MTTSLRDLLAQARLEADQSPATIPAAQAAITALGHVSRALHSLTGDDDPLHRRPPNPDQLQLSAALARDTDTAAVGWPPTSGRLPDLAGAAADVIGRLAPQLDAAERWALTVALAETARHCTDAARRPATYRALRPLTAAHAAAAAVEQHATDTAPSTVSLLVLDRLIPVSDLDPATPTLQRTVAAVAGLIAAVRVAVSHRDLTVGDALAATSVARVAATHAAEFAGQLARRGAPPQDWQASPAAWRAVQLSYASIDDGTKPTPPTSTAATASAHVGSAAEDSAVVGSAVIAWAVRLHDGLHAQFATPSPPSPSSIPPSSIPPSSIPPAAQPPAPWPAALPPDRLSHGQQPGLDDAATVLRTVVNHLPELARLLEHAANTWTRSHTVYAPVRRLPSYEQDNLTPPAATAAVVAAATTAAGAAERIVAVGPGDLAETITALREADRLSASLSAELDHTSRVYGTQAQPYLAAAHRAATDQSTPLARSRRAQAATRRAGATQPGEWTLPPRPPRGR